MKKRILIHSLVFNPDGVSTAYLYGDIALALKQAGHEVKVLTTTPHYNRVALQIERQPLRWKIWGVLKTSDFHGITVYHVPQRKFKSTLLRLAGFVYWHVVSFLTALFLGRADVILSPSPPLTIGWLNIWIGRLKGAKVIYNVQEIYPDILGKSSGVAFRFLRWMEKRVYDGSAAVTTIDEVFYKTIVGRFKHPERLHIVPNFVDTDLYKPTERYPDLDKALFRDNGNLKLLYAGNIGMAQDWKTLIETAKRTAGRPVDYYVIGDGVMKEFVVSQVAEHNLRNVHVLPYQPRELMPQIIAFSDIQYIFMEPETAAQGFPSKMYTIMASAKPLLVCSPENTPIVNFLSGIGCARIFSAPDVETKARGIGEWLESVTREELAAMGAKGLEIVRSTYSKEVVTRRYCEIIENL